MTPQEQYPKFYSHPHYWIDAIEVESIKGYPVFGQNGVTRKRTYKLTHGNLNEFIADGDLKDYIPKFNPQEGEAFIKDLEAAVNAGCTLRKYQFVCNDNDGAYVFDTLTGYRVMVSTDNISNVCTAINGLGEKYFDTSAYVDKLRELGYYI